jgi:hypothetical protein
MYHYKLRSATALSGDTVRGLIDLGFGTLVDYRIKLFGVLAPSVKLDKSIKNSEERASLKKRGVSARNRLKELLAFGAKQPEGLSVKTFLSKDDGQGEVSGDIKYIYARDLYNNQPGEDPWVGWKSISSQLLQEELVDSNL